MKRVPCLLCGTPIAAGKPCPNCGQGTLNHDDAEYRVNAAIIRAAATYCHICGRQFEHGDAISVDHIVALANGGTHDLDNLAAAHPRCNKRKGA